MIMLGMQTEGSKAGRKMAPLFVAFNQILRKYTNRSYCESIKEFSVILRVSGELGDFGFEGLKYLRRSRKNNYITIDAGIPQEHWKDASETHLKEYLANLVQKAVHCMIERLKKDKELVNEAQLWTDYDTASKEFLSGQFYPESVVTSVS
jgi:hypothetical protein